MDRVSENCTDLKQFFKNMQIVFKKYTPAQLNKAMIKILNKKDNKITEIDYVFQTVAYHYGISVKKIKSKYNRGKALDAMHIVYCLLHFDLRISMHHISKNIFLNYTNSVRNGIERLKSCNKDIKIDKEFAETYEQLSKIIIKFIAEQNNKN